MSLSGVTLQILLLTVMVFTVSGVQKLTITPDRGTNFNIRSSSQPKGCNVCTGAGRSRRCNTSLLLRDNTPVSLEFECSRPQDVFSVEIVRNIECTTKSCNSHIIQADSGSLPLLDFDRKFTWNLKASAPKAFNIDFSNTGLRQINPSERCPDRHSYTLQAFQTTGNVAVGKYCRTGTIRSAQILNQGSFSLDVPAGQKLQSGQFDVSVGEEIKSLAKITLTLPKGASSSELLSPNYPESFPDDGVMEWYFQVPEKHKTAVQLLQLIQPRCLKKDTAVEYQSKGRVASVLRLTDRQPEQSQGNFSLMLRNCEMDRRRAASPGLSLTLKVSSSESSPVLCKVDVSKMEGLSLHIEKLRPASYCEMKINSVLKEKITVTSHSDLTFQDCLPEDVQVTAMGVMECSQLKECPKTPARLSLPLLPTCLPANLSSVTWALRPPQHGTVELTSPTGPLKQSVPGQPCNDSIIIKVTEDGGTTVGHFCTQGSIQMVQIHTNVSVTVSGIGGEALRMSGKDVLNARLKEEISESYIFTVSPKRDTPVLLATPGWPVGMRSDSTVSWIVSVPERMDAHLVFANLRQPKCSSSHTDIRVQRVGRREEDYSRREDEEAESQITVSDSFYLNMSNCMPERGEFSVITEITLQKSKNFLLTIILSAVAALVVIFVIVLAVVCVVIRKKKKELTHQVSIYNPNGSGFLPGHNGFPKTREDNESHVYASIEDTLVYTHLLRKGVEFGIYGEFDTSRPFTGHTDSQKPLISEDAGVADVQVGPNQQFRDSSIEAPPLPERPPSHGQQLVDNEIYQTEDQHGEERCLDLGLRLEPEGGN
ncbi:CUB domain-containing protein 1-like [Micropterus dolomieu]|uniref:CUB domain-containing protein 1-like n=1 Tax=Micropterus dolomieu TaxID=147949 RepID=UPI001E8E32D9|nr:CUB domain-containing protein 1-like [Micropterus dolomieu]